jgi:hypothetical protein
MSTSTLLPFQPGSMTDALWNRSATFLRWIGASASLLATSLGCST